MVLMWDFGLVVMGGLFYWCRVGVVCLDGWM